MPSRPRWDRKRAAQSAASGSSVIARGANHPEVHTGSTQLPMRCAPPVVTLAVLGITGGAMSTTLTQRASGATHVATDRLRLAPFAGIAFVMCFIGSVVASNPPKSGASDRTWIANYTGSANKAHHVVTGVLLVLAALALMTFLTALWRRIGNTHPLPLVAAAAGTAAIAVGGVVMGAVGEIITNHSGPGVANLFRLANGLGFALVALAGMPAIALCVAWLSVHGRRAGVFGRGLSTLGLVAAVALLAALAFVPIVVLFVWVG